MGSVLSLVILAQHDNEFFFTIIIFRTGTLEAHSIFDLVWSSDARNVWLAMDGRLERK